MPHPNQMSPGKGVFHKYIKHFLSAFFGEKNQNLSGIFKAFCLKFGEAVKDRKGALMAGREKPLKSILSDSISFNATLSPGKVQAAQPEGEEETCLHWLGPFIV